MVHVIVETTNDTRKMRRMTDEEITFFFQNFKFEHVCRGSSHMDYKKISSPTTRINTRTTLWTQVKTIISPSPLLEA